MSRRRAISGLALVVSLCLCLGLIGLGVEARLQPLSLDVPGTPSSEAEAIVEDHFGSSSSFSVLLQGPAQALERQGPRLVRVLRRQPRATVISPWDRGSLSDLRPDPGKALILLDFHVPLDQAMRDTVPRLEGS